MECTIVPESDLEARICSDERWIAGIQWGEPRPGHPEGSIAAHIAEILGRIDAAGLQNEVRALLRLIGLIHDAFKREVDTSLPRAGGNHHGMIARLYAQEFIEERYVLDVIEL